MASIKDVASLANVAIGTVSKYINGGEVRESKRIEIEKAINQLNYRVNLSARSLKTSKSRTIGIIINDITSDYYPNIIKEIENLLYKMKYSIIIVDSNRDSKTERSKINFLMEKQIDGFIIFPLTNSDDNYNYILNCNIPLCLVDVFTPNVNCIQIVSDNVYSTYEATSLLINQGHKEIAFVSSKSITSENRFKGYSLAMQTSNLEIQHEYTYMEDIAKRSDLGYQAMDYLTTLKQSPTAVIAYNSQTFLGVVSYCSKNNINIGKDIEVVGYDMDFLSTILNKPMYVIKQNIEEIAKTTVESCLDLIENNEIFEKPCVKLIKTKLIKTTV